MAPRAVARFGQLAGLNRDRPHLLEMAPHIMAPESYVDLLFEFINSTNDSG